MDGIGTHGDGRKAPQIKDTVVTQTQRKKAEKLRE